MQFIQLQDTLYDILQLNNLNGTNNETKAYYYGTNRKFVIFLKLFVDYYCKIK